MNVRCPRCAGTVHGRRGQDEQTVIATHVALGCPAPPPKKEHAR